MALHPLGNEFERIGDLVTVARQKLRLTVDGSKELVNRGCVCFEGGAYDQRSAINRIALDLHLPHAASLADPTPFGEHASAGSRKRCVPYAREARAPVRGGHDVPPRFGFRRTAWSDLHVR